MSFTGKVFGGAALGFIGLLALGSHGTSTNPSKSSEIINADVAAQVGDTVTISYPASTIMCSARNDASLVYVAGEIAMRQAMRIENSIWKAVEAERAAQKYAMAKAYTCEWAPRDARFIVQQKEIVGDKSSLFHVADYCLRPESRSADKTCWWIQSTATMNALIERVASPKHDQQEPK